LSERDFGGSAAPQRMHWRSVVTLMGEGYVASR
jgi:hypothetical protein